MNTQATSAAHRVMTDHLHQVEAALQTQHYVAVRRRIFRQLIASLIYEGVVAARCESRREDLVFFIQGEDDASHPVTYCCRGRRRWSFDRIQLGQEPVIRISQHGASEAQSLSQFLLEVCASIVPDADRLGQFIGELDQTLLKDTLARYHQSRRGTAIIGQSYDTVETILPDGHPYHPSYKSRVGFDYLDNADYGPEFAPSLRPIWLAAHRDWTRATASQGIDLRGFLTQELGEAVHARFLDAIRQQGHDPDDYLLVPVHPWQWRNQVVAKLFSDLRDGRLIALGEAEDVYRPQQSIRTLANVTTAEKAYLKLALSIVNTSTSRVLAPHTVQNAPLVTDWLQQVVREDAFLREEVRPVILGEVLGIAYTPRQPECLQAETYGALSCIWRESLHQFLSPDEQAAPWTTLCHIDPNGQSFIEPWVREMGVVPWVRRLLRVSVLPIIHFLCAHGIALEAHAQNMVLVHKNGWPERVALRDFHDGIRFSPAHLPAGARRPSLHRTPPSHARVNRNSYIETDDPIDVRDFMLDAFLFINLSELAIHLSDHFGLDERQFWGLCREVIADYQERFPHLRERFELFDLFAPTVQVEQLTKRRLFPETERRVHHGRNPLARVAGIV